MRIDGHIIKTELLKDGDWVLDAGCRGFTLQAALGDKYNYLALDPDVKIQPESECLFTNMIIFERKALMPTTGKANYAGWSYGDGNFITNNPPPYATERYEVETISVKDLMAKYDIKQFTLAKLDIESSEYDVLLSIDFPFATQVCVEFHQCLGFNRYGSHQQYIDKLMASDFGKYYKIEEWYEYENIKGMYEYLFLLK